MRTKKQKSNMIGKIIIVFIFISAIAVIINLAPNYMRNELTGKINVIINNNNVTTTMKFDAFVDENDVVYLSTKDIANFFDEDIFYDNKYNQIITSSDKKLASLKIDEKLMYVNSSKVKIHGTATKKNNQFYLPFSEMNDVYNVEVNYIKETNIVTIDSLEREQKRGNANKNISIKYKPTSFSRTVDKAKQGDSLIIVKENENGWTKVRTNLGKIGYTKDISNIYTQREQMDNKKQIDEKISLVWDYFVNSAPDRTETSINGINAVSPSFIELVDEGKGEVINKINTTGANYIEWAHSQNYKVWAMVSNNSYQNTTSEILNDYKLREKLINNIVNITIQNHLDGINIDFENVKGSDKQMLSRFIIELAPRLKEYGKVLSVDVTAPDGSEDWSECYDRNKIGKVADYIIFMAYDQYGSYSKTPGTTAGANWVEINIKKFIDREEVSPEKLILAIPFYTRVWKETSNGYESVAIGMKNIENTIPQGTKRTWDEELKQYFVEYTKSNNNYKMWIEDERSIKEKISLMKKYKLAGSAYWRKDFESQNIWNIIQEEME